MEISIIENQVNYLLENSPIGREGGKETSREALFPMLMAAAIMDTMSDEKKKELIKNKKHFDYFFSTKLNIKKHSRKEKKKASPHTPYKDKAEKEREIEGESFGDGRKKNGGRNENSDGRKKIPADETKIPSDEIKILSDETKIPADEKKLCWNLILLRNVCLCYKSAYLQDF